MLLVRRSVCARGRLNAAVNTKYGAVTEKVPRGLRRHSRGDRRPRLSSRAKLGSAGGAPSSYWRTGVHARRGVAKLSRIARVARTRSERSRRRPRPRRFVGRHSFSCAAKPPDSIQILGGAALSRAAIKSADSIQAPQGPIGGAPSFRVLCGRVGGENATGTSYRLCFVWQLLSLRAAVSRTRDNALQDIPHREVMALGAGPPIPKRIYITHKRGLPHSSAFFAEGWEVRPPEALLTVRTTPCAILSAGSCPTASGAGHPRNGFDAAACRR